MESASGTKIDEHPLYGHGNVLEGPQGMVSPTVRGEELIVAAGTYIQAAMNQLRSQIFQIAGNERKYLFVMVQGAQPGVQFLRGVIVYLNCGDIRKAALRVHVERTTPG